MVNVNTLIHVKDREICLDLSRKDYIYVMNIEGTNKYKIGKTDDPKRERDNYNSNSSIKSPFVLREYLYVPDADLVLECLEKLYGGWWNDLGLYCFDFHWADGGVALDGSSSILEIDPMTNQFFLSSLTSELKTLSADIVNNFLADRFTSFLGNSSIPPYLLSAIAVIAHDFARYLFWIDCLSPFREGYKKYDSFQKYRQYKTIIEKVTAKINNLICALESDSYSKVANDLDRQLECAIQIGRIKEYISELKYSYEMKPALNRIG